MTPEMIVARALDRHTITTHSYLDGGVRCQCEEHVADTTFERNNHLAEVAVQTLRDAGRVI